MPRSRSPNRDKAFEIYKEHNGKITLREIAKILDTPEKTISGWKVKDKWDSNLNGVLQINKRSTPNKKNNNKSNKEPVATEVKEVLENTELTDKQRLFCIYYVKYRNKTKAYMKAYKCTWENANAHAYELWENVGVRQEIDKQLKELRDNIKIDIQDLIQLNIDIAFADMNDYVEFGQEEVPVMGPFGPIVVKEKGKQPKEITKIVNVVRFKKSSEVDGTIISEVKQGKDGASIKLQDKMKAIDFLDKHIDDLNEETKHKLDIEHKKLANDKLKFEIQALKGETNDSQQAINSFIEATSKKPEDISKMFEGENNEDI